ncbi:MAG: hypothetical protein BWY79_01786 [Actinobacteria bacterium ADurb.Bin444]|nr:MAG: hypothetical protein BWY79_01786 [Actinobacteria bacterium ADurb.Bin444]
MIDGLAKPRHVCGHRQILIVQFRLAVLHSPGFAHQAGRVLCRSHRRLFPLPLVRRHALFGGQGSHSPVAHIQPETPVVLSAHEPLPGPLVIAPPHGAEGEEVLHLFAVVSVELVGVVRVAVMRVLGIGLRGRIVVWVGIPDTAAIGVHTRIGVVQQERLAIPHEPQVLVLPGLVDAVVQVLHHGDDRSIEGPEAELRHLVPLRLHLLHHREDHVPLVPVTHRIGDIHHQHVHPGVREHRHVLADHPLVLAQEVPHLRLGPVVRAFRPQGMVGIQASGGVLRENLRHVSRIRASRPVSGVAVPGDIEDADNSPLVGLHRPHVIE